MPEGVTADKITEGARFLAEVCKVRGFNLAMRLHVLLWGHTRGT